MDNRPASSRSAICADRACLPADSDRVHPDSLRSLTRCGAPRRSPSIGCVPSRHVRRGYGHRDQPARDRCPVACYPRRKGTRCHMSLFPPRFTCFSQYGDICGDNAKASGTARSPWTARRKGPALPINPNATGVRLPFCPLAIYAWPGRATRLGWPEVGIRSGP